MKRFKSWLAVRITVCSLLLAMGSACVLGNFISVPWIRIATRNDVVNIGDSIYALTGGIHNYLQLFAWQTFRNYCVVGAYMQGASSVTSTDIETQYAIARSDSSNIKTIFMDGGGNEVLLPAILGDPYQCKTNPGQSLSATCTALINDGYVEHVNFLNQMGRDGVKNIIFLEYYHCKDGILGNLSTLNAAVDYGDTMIVKEVTNATAVNNYRVCVDPRSSINNSDILPDGVHPADSGSYKCASLIWPYLKSVL
jgi:hypothetical protein